MMETPVEAQPKKSNTGWIIGAIVVVLLCCCCAVVVIATLMLMGPAVGKVFSSINDGILTPPTPSFPVPQPDSGTPPAPSDLIPSGGNGDQVQRASAWGYVVIKAAFDGCAVSSPTAVKIAVTHPADSKGVWKEQWTLTCDGGGTKIYDVTFTPGAGGSTDIDVTSGQ